MGRRKKERKGKEEEEEEEAAENPNQANRAPRARPERGCNPISLPERETRHNASQYPPCHTLVCLPLYTHKEPAGYYCCCRLKYDRRPKEKEEERKKKNKRCRLTNHDAN